MREKLILLRDRIDEISKLHTDISFISFADSLLLKSNWQVGTFDSEIKYSYKPEIFISLFLDIQRVYREVVGLNIYAVLTQGSNEFYDDPLLHISSTNNHISLNSFGLPFAQLVSIERTARTAIKNGTHRRAELYMDEDFFHSLNLLHDLKKEDCKRNNYQEPLLGESRSYFIADCNQILIA